MAPTSVLDAPTTIPQGRWVGRPNLARLVRGAVAILPVVLAIIAGWGLAKVLPDATSSGGAWAQRLLILGFASAVAWASGPLARRLMPLGALLELTLVFPDQAPPRMATALNAKSTTGLAELIARTKREGLPEDSTEAATTILKLVGALSRHDRITRGHSERVRAYAALIGREMGLSEERIDRLGWAGLLHDIGKLTIDEDILNKPSKLTDEEYTIIKGHAAAGAEMVAPLRDWLGSATDAVGQHHERWDGTGYPNGLRGEEIALEARIMAVADVFDVITALRSYKTPSSPAEARMEIARCAGTQFDPQVVRAFLAISMSDFKLTRGPLAVLAQWPIVASITATGALPAVGSAVAASAVLGASASMPAANVYDFLNRADLAAEAVQATEEVTEPEATATPVAAAASTDTAAGPARTAPARPASSNGGEAGADGPNGAAPVAPPSQPATSGRDTTATSGGGTSAAAGGGAAAAAPAGSSPDSGANAEFERAVEEARAEAADRHGAVDVKLATKLADIDAKDAEERAKAQETFDEDTADAQRKRDEAEAELVEMRAERDEKIAEIDADLAEELADLRADRDEDLAKVDRDRRDGKITQAEAEAKRREIEDQYRADVAEAGAKAQEDRDKENAEVAKAEREAREDYEEATSEAQAELDAALAKNAAKRAEERAEARAEAAEDHADIDEWLADELRKIEERYDMPPGSA